MVILTEQDIHVVVGPDLQIRGGGGLIIQTLSKSGAVLKEFLSGLRVSVWSKNKGGPSPGSAIDMYLLRQGFEDFSNSKNFFCIF